MKRDYPFNAWVLGGTFIPKQIIFIGKGWDSDWHLSEGGKGYFHEDVFQSKDQAVAAGREKLAKQQARIKKQQDGIDKKRANLDKHS